MSSFTFTPDASFIAGYGLPEFTFTPATPLPASLQGMWDKLRRGDVRAALIDGRTALQGLPPVAGEARAAILAGMAAAEARLGNAGAAQRTAEASLVQTTRQWMAHRVLLQLFLGRRDYEAAYLYVATLDLPYHTWAWDEPLQPREHHLTTAACAWHAGDWEGVAERLALAFPEGITTMPVHLMEDWFRLALYREQPRDAAAVAALLLAQRQPEAADALLQTLVQRGWTAQALPLYRVLYRNHPQNALLRRRLVALCIREGAFEEARILTRPGALELAA